MVLVVNTIPTCLKSLGCVAFDDAAPGPRKENEIIMHDLDVQI